MAKILMIGSYPNTKVLWKILMHYEYMDYAVLDDEDPSAIGKIADYEKFVGEYRDAFVYVMDNHRRAELMKALKKVGYQLPALVHPDAFVSEDAYIGEGVFVEATAVVRMGAKIGAGTLILGKSYVDSEAQVGAFCILEKGCTVDSSIQPEAYAIVKGYKPVIKRIDDAILDENGTPIDTESGWRMESAQQRYEDTKIKPPKPPIEDSPKKSRKTKTVKYNAFDD